MTEIIDVSTFKDIAIIQGSAEKAIRYLSNTFQWSISRISEASAYSESNIKKVLEGSYLIENGVAAIPKEVKTVSSTGGEKGTKLESHSQIPIDALRALAEHYGKGAIKYSPSNWRRGYEWSKSYDALERHLKAFWGGEDIDPETGSRHITAVAWHAFALYTFMDEFPNFDDRFSTIGVPEKKEEQ